MILLFAANTKAHLVYAKVEKEKTLVEQLIKLKSEKNNHYSNHIFHGRIKLPEAQA